MTISTTAERLKEIMVERKLRQVDVLDLAKPFCEQFHVKLGKSDLSQYLHGVAKPGSSKLTILGLALNVNEAWLMGLDVPREREDRKQETRKQETREVLSEGGMRLLLDADSKLTQEQLNEIVNFIRYQQQKNDRQ